ncbi:MAG: hypothetical protein WCJ85_10555 [Chitinophagaceae bacterium]
MRYLSVFGVLLFLIACNNGGTAEQPIKDSLVKDKPIVLQPVGPPAKVNGAFAGVLPCSDCEKQEVLLVLTDLGYDRSVHKVAPKKKFDLLGSTKGNCTQDSGFICLLSPSGKAIEWYEIISLDSIELVTNKSQPVSKGQHFYLTRKDGQKLGK